MSVFHYKANLIKREQSVVHFRFYPDYIDAESVFGEFKIDTENWTPVIILRTEINNRETGLCNERPVGALAYKIKKYFEEKGELPLEIFYIA